jgi:hypothetical protein
MPGSGGPLMATFSDSTSRVAVRCVGTVGLMIPSGRSIGVAAEVPFHVCW